MSEQRVNDGGPAFPVDLAGDGMSLRDYFAAHAPEQLPGNPDLGGTAAACGVDAPKTGSSPAEYSAFWIRCEAILRYRYADAMLAAREGK